MNGGEVELEINAFTVHRASKGLECSYCTQVIAVSIYYHIWKFNTNVQPNELKIREWQHEYCIINTFNGK